MTIRQIFEESVSVKIPPAPSKFCAIRYLKCYNFDKLVTNQIHIHEYSTTKLLSNLYLVVTITHIHISVATNHNNNVITYTDTNHSMIVDYLTSARDCSGVAYI